MTGNNYYILGNLAKEEYKDYRRIDGYLHPYKMCIISFPPYRYQLLCVKLCDQDGSNICLLTMQED